MDETLRELLPQPDAPEPLAGMRVGPYEIVREIGRGGMGAVYLAVRADDEYHQRVAVKVVKRGMDTDFVLQRFREERQILANLEHPSIGRLLDGGTTDDGRPYLVMEYIEGEPIDRYCQANGLDVRARVQLFRGICAAVQHAHQGLVIHCDLKPRNVLVTAKGEPKLLDFGIAKLLSPEATSTRTVTSLRQMTPEYASPEQVRGEVLTTATDVYSLGVMLYELLTGRRPYRLSGFSADELERVICREEPRIPSEGLAAADEAPTRAAEGSPAPPAPRASARRRELRGDLDNIVMMAMRKEPARRYASAEQLGEDLRRHLDGLPVLARPDTFGYRAGLFVRRHRGSVLAAGLVLLSLLGGVLLALSQARVARAERAKAERRLGEVRQLAQSLIFEFHDAIQDLEGATPARELLVRRGLEYLDRLARESSGDGTLQLELAAAYQKVGDVQGRPGFANLGDRQGALSSYRKALELRYASKGHRPPDASNARDLATNLERIGDLLLVGGDPGGAGQIYAEALKLREPLLVGAGDDTLHAELAGAYQRSGDALAATGDVKGAAAAQEKALAIQVERGSRAEATPAARRDLFIGYMKAGNRQAEAGDHAAALRLYRQGKGIAAALRDVDPTNGRARRELAVAHDKVGDALRATDELQSAIDEYEAALDIREALSAADPRNAELVRDRSVSHAKLGEALFDQGHSDQALASLRRALHLDEAALRADPSDDQARLDIAADHESIGRVLAGTGRHEEALQSYRRAHDIWSKAFAKNPENAAVGRELARLYVSLGRSEVEVALAAATGAEARARHCGAARTWLGRARSALLALGEKAPLIGPDAELPRLVEEAEGRCPPSPAP